MGAYCSVLRLSRYFIHLFLFGLALFFYIFSFSGFSFADEALFVRHCGICHVYSPSGDSGGRAGPNLYGIEGRIAGSVADFENYSKALSESGVIWTREILDRWLENPKSVIPGTYMVYKQRKAEIREKIINYMIDSTNE